jgi:hypothetical protein
VKALDHDFGPDAVVIPIGILLPQFDELWLYFVPVRATADTYADVLELFWNENKARFPETTQLVLDQDNGPENNSRRTQFMHRMVQFVDNNQIEVKLAYYPPYHSKYNPVERCWAVAENEWSGDLLDTVEAAVGHAESMTWKGKHPIVTTLQRIYDKGIKLGKEAMQEIEKRLDRLPGLEKYFVQIEPEPVPA